MPASWLITAPSRMQALDLESVALLLDAPREPTPARAMLAFVNRLAPVEFISLVTYASGGPELIEGHAQSAGLRNVVGECFARYRVLAVAPLLRQVHRNALGSPREGNGVQERIAARAAVSMRALRPCRRASATCARGSPAASAPTASPPTSTSRRRPS